MFTTRQLICVSKRGLYSSSRILQNQKNDLYLHPERWVGLKSSKIFELYEERVLKLGAKYEKSNDELNALLSTSRETSVPTSVIRGIYNIRSDNTEDMAAGKLGNFNPLKDGTIETYKFDEYSSTAQDLVDQHRTSREYNRIAAYELPLLAKYRSEYVSPAKDQTLQVRFTNYIGEEHPADKKVVIRANFDEFTNDLKLSEKEKHKLKLILGKRYNQINNQIHMSFEKFQYPTQNFKYALVLLQNILKEIKTERKGDEDYSVLPLDTRLYAKQYENKVKRDKINAFPKEWLRPQDAPIKKNPIEFSVLDTLNKKL